MARSIAVDVGGTFTDLIYRDDASGEVVLGKVSTIPAAPDEGVLAVLDATLSAEQVRGADSFRHGTTVGLNALLEGRGATVGLLATRGFRDVLELRRGDRDDPYDLFWAPPPPMVARQLRRPVTERVLAGGEIDTALDEADVLAAAGTFAEAGVTAVAIAFMNAYVNPVHERRAAECLRAAGFEGHLSLSHRVSGEYREYERTTTTVIDAFVRGRMNSYLGRLEAGLRERAFRGQCLIMRSGGGAMTFEEAADRSVETILSGPVAGARAVAELAGDLALEHAVAADVGGTSFDTCLIDHGRPPVLYEGTVRGLPIQTPWIDVRSIGAGGGSIAQVDAGGLLRVGPHSAGADPGPAAYGRGGSAPTVTDAAVVLGMLPAEEISGGVTLDRALAEASFAELTERLGFSSAAEVARGVVQIVVAQMGDAIRGVTVDRGQDPRRASLVAFGGAGPLFGGLLAAELGAQAVIVPSYAGNFSAWGLLRAEIARTASRTYMAGLSSAGLDGAREVAEALFAQLEAGEGDDALRRSVQLDIRFVGQEHTLTVAGPMRGGAIASEPELLGETFLREYDRTFGSTIDEQIEIVCVRAIVDAASDGEPAPAANGHAPPVDGHAQPAGGHARPAAAPAPARTWPAWSFTAERELPFALVQRAELEPCGRLDGPAIVLESTATTYLDDGHALEVHPQGALVISRTRTEEGQGI
jgi:N-methylhydantoinase A